MAPLRHGRDVFPAVVSPVTDQNGFSHLILDSHRTKMPSCVISASTIREQQPRPKVCLVCRFSWRLTPPPQSRCRRRHLRASIGPGAAWPKDLPSSWTTGHLRWSESTTGSRSRLPTSIVTASPRFGTHSLTISARTGRRPRITCMWILFFQERGEMLPPVWASADGSGSLSVESKARNPYSISMYKVRSPHLRTPEFPGLGSCAVSSAENCISGRSMAGFLPMVRL